MEKGCTKRRGLVQTIRYDGDVNENMKTQMKTGGRRSNTETTQAETWAWA